MFNVAALHEQKWRNPSWVATVMLSDTTMPVTFFEGSKIQAMIEKWCQKNCNYRWYFGKNLVYFDDGDDACLFNLTFCKH